MSIYSSLRNLAASQLSTIRQRRTQRALDGLPSHIRKDIGYVRETAPRHRQNA